jgi:hypothetical protein
MSCWRKGERIGASSGWIRLKKDLFNTLLLLLLLLLLACFTPPSCRIFVPPNTTWERTSALADTPAPRENNGGGTKPSSSSSSPFLFPFFPLLLLLLLLPLPSTSRNSFNCGVLSPVSIASFTIHVPLNINKSHGTSLSEGAASSSFAGGGGGGGDTYPALRLAAPPLPLNFARDPPPVRAAAAGL